MAGRGEGAGVGSLYKKIPTNIRLFMEQMFGADSPITEEDFTAEELEAIRRQITEQQRKNTIREENVRNNTERYERMMNNPLEGDSGVTAGLTPEGLADRQRALDSYERTRNRTSVNPYSLSGYREPGGAIRKSFTSPGYNIATTLGKYRAEQGEEGVTTIQDTYDWNVAERSEHLPKGLAALRSMMRNPEIFGEFLMRMRNPSPREINITLPSGGD